MFGQQGVLPLKEISIFNMLKKDALKIFDS